MEVILFVTMSTWDELMVGGHSLLLLLLLLKPKTRNPAPRKPPLTDRQTMTDVLVRLGVISLATDRFCRRLRPEVWRSSCPGASNTKL